MKVEIIMMNRDQNNPGKNKQPAEEEIPEELRQLGEPELDPFEIEFLPEFREGRGPRAPFVNEHGVVIGDHMYASPDSPLELWTKDTDPAVMAGDSWVHPYKDIGFHSAENKDFFEKGIASGEGRFMHASHNTAQDMAIERTADDSDDAEDDETEWGEKGTQQSSCD